ncbi:hypothetical protein H6P81_018867 [Aristolochia fimbriata]|uniref:Uncharacterized protein n=1 Tax=Aristolochia fimbriata TaxID=158543 RepID=A0AAV7E6L1_ARIFI|nr:hypothetical protein H6P81_018867 [Aristolochia fimbriata]
MKPPDNKNQQACRLLFWYGMTRSGFSFNQGALIGALGLGRSYGWLLYQQQREERPERVFCLITGNKSQEESPLRNSPFSPLICILHNPCIFMSQFDIINEGWASAGWRAP